MEAVKEDPKRLVIVGAGDFGREVSFVVERLNRQGADWNLLGYVDDNEETWGTMADGYPVLGPVDYLRDMERPLWTVCSIGTGHIRAKVMERVLSWPGISAATLVDPSVIVGRGVQIGEGSVVCPGTVLAIDASLGAHTIVNLNCTIGHDTVLEDCCTVHPGSNLSGKVHVGRSTDIGTGTKIIQGLSVAPGSILGAGAVVVRDIREPGTYVGVPAISKKSQGGGILPPDRG